MAIPVARVHLAMAHAALPTLLPTLPQWTMMPLPPTPPCVVILPKSLPPKPGSADAVERWDAGKNATSKSPCKPGRADAAVERSNSKSPSKPGRADADERWNAHKITKPASPSSSSSSSQSSPDDTSSSSGRASANERWDSNKRAISCGSSSAAERWDAHKKHRPTMLPAEELDDDSRSSTGSNDDMEFDMPPRALYAGPGFVASPEPSMLPMPSFMVLSRCIVV